jgi:type I restriction enzyme, S subunit
MTIAACPTYHDCVDTGFAPIGSVPQHWVVVRIRHAAEISPSRRLDGNTSRDDQVVFLPMEAVGDNGQVNQSYRRVAKEVCEGFTYFRKGDVIMAKITPCFENGKGAYLDDLATDYGFGTTELHVLRPKRILGEFLYYFLNRKSFRSYSEVFMVGSAGQKRVSTDFLKNQLIPLPPLPEQRAIAAFLDEKCFKIDEAVRIKEAQIALLRERRQILIQQAVTRGLNPDAPMNDSGIDWIGQIPAYWEVRRSKYVFTQRKELARKDDIQLSATQSYGVIPQDEFEELVGRRVVKIQTNLEKRKHVEIDDFVISMRSFQGGLERAFATGCIRSSYVILQPLEPVNADFFGYLFKSPRYIKALQATGSFIRDGQDLNFDNFSKVDLFLPPLDEQKEIAAHIKTGCEKIDNGITIKQDQITTLKEYKTCLVNAAVTGKIKVA